MAKILIVSPHADDEIIGCGGMMARHGDDNEIDVVIMALGCPRANAQVPASLRIKEMNAAHKLLSINSTAIVYRNQSGFLDEIPMFDIVGELDKILDRGYDEVYYPAICHMHDHAIVNKACHAALRPGAHWPMPRLVAEYEHNWPGWSSVEGNLYLKLQEKDVLKKMAAMKCYQSQLSRHSDIKQHPISLVAIMQMLEMRGYECGCNYAERYNMVYGQV